MLQAGQGSRAGEDRESGLGCRKAERTDREDSPAGEDRRECWREGRWEGRGVSYPEVELRG